MRKYAIPRPVYFMIILMLILLSFGSTYAYFSSKVIATADMSMHNVNVAWADMSSESTFSRDGLISANFSNINDIVLVNKLKRGESVQIQCVDNKNATVDVFLSVATDEASTPVYCRIKIQATYNNGTEDVDFSEHIQPKYKFPNSTGTLENVSIHDWVYENGYYYYKQSGNLKSINGNQTIRFANYIYLSEECSADLLGREVSLSFTVEAVQASASAVSSVWGI